MAPKTPTKKSGTTSIPATPGSNKKQTATPKSIENDLPLPPQESASVEKTDLEAYFAPLPPSRSASIYSVNRATLSGQLSQLTSTDLPDAESLAAKISALPTASAAAKALTNSAKQIKSWIRTAADVLGGLDAHDDVEWAGSGSKDGVKDVEIAMNKFERLVVTYITAVEDAQKRADIKTVTKAEMTAFLDTLEEVVIAWEEVKSSLQKVKTQNEFAMEWEELWNTVLGDIGRETEELITLVFELEEKRYAGSLEEATELETITEEDSAQRSTSRGPKAAQPASPLESPKFDGPAEDTGLLTLFARLQTLRASLEFLPMQLTAYEMKAEEIFPSACAELQARKFTLVEKYQNLERDAETLRRELGEDKWVIVFRNAAKQAQKMCESVEKGVQKLRDALKDEVKASNTNLLAKKIADYEAKRNNYGPAIQKVLAMIDKGVKDRATVNGEILRIHTETHQIWSKLEKKILDTDSFLHEAQATRKQELRDSISTIMSTDMSGIASNVVTPDSSLASSPAVDPADRKASFPTTPDMSLPRSQASSVRSLSSSRPAASRRIVSQPATASATSRRHTSLMGLSRLTTASPLPGHPPRGATPMSTIPSSRTATPGTATAAKPRWSVGSAVNRKLLDSKPTFTPTAYARRLKDSKPSVYSCRSPSGSAMSSGIPSPSPLGRSRYSTSNTPARAVSSLGIRSRRDSSPTPSYGSAAGSMNDETRPRSRLYRPSLPASTTSSSIRLPSYNARQDITRRTSLLPLPASPSGVPTVTVQNGSASNSVYGDEEEEILPSIEDDIGLPIGIARFQGKAHLRPATSMAHYEGSVGPYVAATRSSLLRAGSATSSGARAVNQKAAWR